MSSQEEDYNEHEGQSSKKRRVQRACDVCRRKKIRCDGGQMPDNRCSNCITYNYDCTYVEAAKKRGPPKGYVESLEIRLEKMEGLLKKLCPDADFSKELGGHFDKEAWLDKTGDKLKGAYNGGPGTSVTQGMAPLMRPTDPDDLEPSDDEILIQNSIVHGLGNMQMHSNTIRFFGKSSSIMFIRTAMDLKHEYTGIDPPPPAPDPGPSLIYRRPDYWQAQPWLSMALDQELPAHQEFPEDDLLNTLVDLYFVNVNEYTPLLHRPTFEDGLEKGLHLADEGFGSVVLLVCAVGARFTRDPRVYLQEYTSTHTCGWKWFQQVQMIRKSLLAPPRLCDLQIYCLAATFLLGTSAPQACWTIVGVGVRLAQDVGAHRRKVYTSVPTVEEELWKRAFWVLVSMDRLSSSALGRPCAIQDEDFDLDLPMECDDEYWENPDPNLRFKQPADKPSKLTHFNCFLRLHQILAFALRTIYSINKSKALLGFVGQQWEQHIVAELDSALNKWIDSVPDHLRWDPNRENTLFLNQSAALYSSYYQIQILVHRPFIPSPRKPSPLSFPSLAICTNAARSCTHVLDIQYKRTGMVMYQNHMALFTAGIVLLLNIWGGKRSGISTDPAKEMADVHKCMKMLRILEPQWHTAGRLWDILYELASVGDLPLPQPTPPSYKRDRDTDSPFSVPSNLPSTSALSPSGDPASRTFAGSRRVSKDTAAASSSYARARTPHVSLSGRDSPLSGAGLSGTAGKSSSASSFALPIHSDELGRLPLHPDFSMPPAPQPMPARDWYTPDDAQRQLETLPRALPTHPLGGDLGAHIDIPSMFAMAPQAPDRGAGGVYDDILAALPPPPAMAGPSGYGPGMAPGAPGMRGDVPADGAGDPSYADNTLAMWSAAPTGFEWDDWGTYISSVSGVQQNPGSVRPQNADDM